MQKFHQYRNLKKLFKINTVVFGLNTPLFKIFALDQAEYFKRLPKKSTVIVMLNNRNNHFLQIAHNDVGYVKSVGGI